MVYYCERVACCALALDQFYERSPGGPDTWLYMFIHGCTWLYPCFRKKTRTLAGQPAHLSSNVNSILLFKNIVNYALLIEVASLILLENLFHTKAVAGRAHLAFFAHKTLTRTSRNQKEKYWGVFKVNSEHPENARGR